MTVHMYISGMCQFEITITFGGLAPINENPYVNEIIYLFSKCAYKHYQLVIEVDIYLNGFIYSREYDIWNKGNIALNISV